MKFQRHRGCKLGEIIDKIIVSVFLWQNGPRVGLKWGFLSFQGNWCITFFCVMLVVNIFFGVYSSGRRTLAREWRPLTSPDFQYCPHETECCSHIPATARITPVLLQDNKRRWLSATSIKFFVEVEFKLVW